MITSEKYIAARNPIILRVDGRNFTVEPLSFNRALHVTQLSMGMSQEYIAMIREGTNSHLVTAEHADALLGTLLNAMEFRGWIPDWLCRAWIKSRAENLSLEGKLRFSEELSRNFTVALLVLRLAARRASTKSSK